MRSSMAESGLLRSMMSRALRVVMFALLTLAGAVPWAATAATTDEYPLKPIRIIVAAAPGTADDFFARVLGEELKTFYRQRVVIDNRAGAGGLIGNQRVSVANADGYTLAM